MKSELDFSKQEDRLKYQIYILEEIEGTFSDIPFFKRDERQRFINLLLETIDWCKSNIDVPFRK